MYLSSRWTKRLSLSCFVLFVSYLFLGCFVIPPIVRNIIVSEGSSFLQRPLKLRNFYFNPLSFEVQLNNLEIADDDGQTFVKIGLMRSNLQLQSITFGGLYLKSVLVEGFEISGKLLPKGKTNIDELLAIFKTGSSDMDPPKPSVETSPLAIFIENIDLKNFNFEFSDHNFSPTFHEKVGPLNIHIANIDTRHHGQKGNMELTMDLADHASFAALAEFQLSPLYSQGKLNLERLQVQRAQTYWEPIIDAQSKALVSFDLPFMFEMLDEKPELQLQHAKVIIKDLVNRSKSHPEFIADIDQIELGLNFSLKQQTIEIEKFAVSGNALQTLVYKDGSLALPLPTASSSNVETMENSAGHAMVSKATEALPWKLALPLANINFPSLRLIDHVSDVEQSHELLNTELLIHDFNFDSRSAPAEIKLNSSIKGGGTINSLWQMDLLSQKGKGEFHLKDFAFNTYNAYFKHYADLQFEDGSVNLNVDVNLGQEISAQANVMLTQTTLLLASSGEPFFGVSANIDGIHYHPKEGLSIDSIKIIGPEALLTMDAQGNISLPQPPSAVSDTNSGNVDAPAPTPSEKSPTPPMPFLVKKFEIVEGRTYFSDQSVSPAFSSNVEAFNMNITNISSDPSQKANIEGSGILDDHGQINFKGSTLPLDFQNSTHVDLSLKTYGLGPISGYLQKYLGRELGSGHFNYEGSFQIDQKILTGNNNFNLDHFKLGSKVESPEAIKLPVDFAIAILTDSRGQIGLDKIEIQGDYNQPGVKTVPLIMQALGKVLSNMIAKAVTSPFTFLSKIAGGGEDLKFASFDVGQTQLNADMLNKLDALSKILIERPLIKLNIKSLFASKVEEQYFKYAQKYIEMNQEIASQESMNNTLDPMDILKAYQPETFKNMLQPLYLEHLITSANTTLTEMHLAASANQQIDLKKGLRKIGSTVRDIFKSETEMDNSIEPSGNTLTTATKSHQVIPNQIDLEALRQASVSASLEDMYSTLYTDALNQNVDPQFTKTLAGLRIDNLELFFIKNKGIPRERFDIELSNDSKANVSILKFDLKI